jgi:hypothetical protein
VPRCRSGNPKILHTCSSSHSAAGAPVAFPIRSTTNAQIYWALDRKERFNSGYSCARVRRRPLALSYRARHCLRTQKPKHELFIIRNSALHSVFKISSFRTNVSISSPFHHHAVQMGIWLRPLSFSSLLQTVNYRIPWSLCFCWGLYNWILQ